MKSNWNKFKVGHQVYTSPFWLAAANRLLNRMYETMLAQQERDLDNRRFTLKGVGCHYKDRLEG